MASPRDIRAGRAFVEVDVDEKYKKKLAEAGNAVERLGVRIDKLKASVGEESTIGKLGKLLVGTGAVAAVGLVARAVQESTAKAIELKDAFNAGKVTAAEMPGEIAKSLPVIGSIANAIENAIELTTGWKASAADVAKEAERIANAMKESAAAVKDLKEVQAGQLTREGLAAGDPQASITRVRGAAEAEREKANKPFQTHMQGILGGEAKPDPFGHPGQISTSIGDPNFYGHVIEGLRKEAGDIRARLAQPAEIKPESSKVGGVYRGPGPEQMAAYQRDQAQRGEAQARLARVNEMLRMTKLPVDEYLKTVRTTLKDELGAYRDILGKYVNGETESLLKGASDAVSKIFDTVHDDPKYREKLFKFWGFDIFAKTEVPPKDGTHAPFKTAGEEKVAKGLGENPKGDDGSKKWHAPFVVTPEQQKEMDDEKKALQDAALAGFTSAGTFNGAAIQSLQAGGAGDPVQRALLDESKRQTEYLRRLNGKNGNTFG
jgi:hypothetical protein